MVEVKLSRAAVPSWRLGSTQDVEEKSGGGGMDSTRLDSLWTHTETQIPPATPACLGGTLIKSETKAET